jgi:hypothetical protein
MSSAPAVLKQNKLTRIVIALTLVLATSTTQKIIVGACRSLGVKLLHEAHMSQRHDYHESWHGAGWQWEWMAKCGHVL